MLFKSLSRQCITICAKEYELLMLSCYDWKFLFFKDNLFMYYYSDLFIHELGSGSNPSDNICFFVCFFLLIYWLWPRTVSSSSMVLWSWKSFSRGLLNYLRTSSLSATRFFCLLFVVFYKNISFIRTQGISSTIKDI